MQSRDNVGFVSVSRQPADTPPGYIFVSDAMIVNGTIRSDSVSIYSLFPLYLYPSEQELDQSRRINFEPRLYARLQALSLHPNQGTPDEVAVFDYIYGVLYCPTYRATYAEFLKIDFPRIPFAAIPPMSSGTSRPSFLPTLACT